MPEELLTVEEVANYLSVHRYTIYRFFSSEEASSLQGRQPMAISEKDD